MKKIIKENLWKNILLIILLILLYFSIHNHLTSSNLVTDTSAASTILVATSIIAVIACFGNFAFTYEKVKRDKASHRYIAHLTTGLLMLIIGISLIFTAILIKFIMGSFIIVDATLLLLYIACVGYDFWDLLRE